MSKTPIISKDMSTKNIKELMGVLKNPQDKIPTIHIGGTNAKGSIISYLESIFKEAGYRVGVFTSPYLWDIRESIRIGNNFISQDSYQDLYKKTQDLGLKYQLDLSEFEILTSVAFQYFDQEKIDLGLIEVGLGGQDDATNIIKKPEAIVFGHISYDHTDILGSSLEEIARVKAGIIRPGSKVYSLDQDIRVKKILDSFDKSIFYLDSSDIRNVKVFENKTSFTYKNKSYTLVMPGGHQAQNASLVIEITSDLEKTYPGLIKAQKKGLSQARIPARIETLGEEPRLVIDGAHNPASLEALLAYLDSVDYKNLVLGFGILADKDRNLFEEKLFTRADHIVLTQIQSDRALDPKKLYEELSQDLKAKTQVQAHIKKALDLSLNLAEDQDLVLWCGSFYLISEIRTLVLGEN